MKYILLLSLLLLFAGSTTSQKASKKALAGERNPIVYDTVSRSSGKMVYTYVGHMPQFDEAKNGSLNTYLSNHTALPADSAPGKVVVSFMIEADGRITDPRIVKSAGSRFDSVAVCLVENMPNWIPARNDAGKAISLRYYLPIRVCAQ